MDCAVLEKELQRENSKAIYKSACQAIVGGVNSPARAFGGLEMTPLVVHSGYKDVIIDSDQNRFIDYCGSWGALIHGHAHPNIVEGAQMRVAMGSSFGCATEIEATLAHKVVSLVDSIEKIRFVSSGTEATMSAVRLARGFTKRDLIVKFNGNYHGHADAFLVQAGSGVSQLSGSSSAGVPKEFVKHTVSLPYNDPEALQNLFEARGSEIAAVIFEPIAANMGVVTPSSLFLEALVTETKKAGALLIFDEVITGFRVGLQGAQGLFGVRPDLSCYGKIIGGGFPAAAFGGRADVMDYLAPNGPVYQAGTLSGNPVAMEAGLQTLLLVEREGFYEELAQKTADLCEPIVAALEGKNAVLHFVTGMFTLFFGQTKIERFADVKQCDSALFKRFYHFMFDNGVYFSPSQFEANFISSVHTRSHLTKTRDLLLEGIELYL